MNFCSEEQDKSKTIKKINITNGVNFEIEYLDDSISKYINYDPNHLKLLKEKMIEQSIERNDLVNYKNLIIDKYLCLFTSLLSSFYLATVLGNSISLLYIICFLIEFFSIYFFRQNNKKINELKKYKLYFEMIKDGEIEIEDICEPDAMYREFIDINNLDEKSLGQINYIKKYKNKKI